MQNFLYIIIGIIFIIIFLRILIKIRVWSRRGKPAPEVGGQLGRMIQKGDKILAYFYSPTCRACKAQEKYFPVIQKRFNNIIRINTAKDHDIALAFGVMGTPTVVVIDGGVIKDYFVGITPSSKILKSLNI
jgi:thiol-disulfide isomerase/thioredoxin